MSSSPTNPVIAHQTIGEKQMNHLTQLHSSRTNFASSATRWPFRTPIFIALTLAAFTFTNSAVAQVSGNVDFGTTKVPAVQNPLTVVRSSPAAAPAAFLQDALSKMGAQTSKIGPLANSPLFADRAKNIPVSTMGLVETASYAPIGTRNPARPRSSLSSIARTRLPAMPRRERCSRKSTWRLARRNKSSRVGTSYPKMRRSSLFSRRGL